MLTRVETTSQFDDWLDELRDPIAQAAIRSRIERLREGNPDDAKPVGRRVWELRVHYGPGYRLYYARRGHALILLLIGGTKGSQRRDIRQAQRIAQDLD